MAKGRHTPEQVISKFRKAGAATAGGDVAGYRRLRPSCLTALSPRLPD